MKKSLWTICRMAWMVGGMALITLPARAQAPLAAASPKFRVVEASERLEMIVNTSRILEMDFKVPRMLVNNPDIVQATPLSPNEVQISALKPGVTNVNLWDENHQVHSVDILVIGDARELSALLQSQFPDASLKVTPLAQSVVISGFVPTPDMVGRIMRIAEDYYPSVINNITVGGAQTVMLQVKVYEVSRTKLRKLGFDWALTNGNDGVGQAASGAISSLTFLPIGAPTPTSPTTFGFSIVNGVDAFTGYLEALRQYNLVKVMAEPNLVAVSGRPARFTSGGEFPILIPQSLGTISVEFREFGTRVDFVPLVLGNGFLRLDVRPEVSEIDPARSVTIGSISVPGLRTRSVDTAVEMRAGQTLAIAGLIQTRTEAQNKGLPWVSDLPWVGSIFRRVEETQNEIELLIMVTPEFVDAVNPEDLPNCYPGELTMSPTDMELYGKGYLEVPKCNACSPRLAGYAMPVGGEPIEAGIVPEETSATIDAKTTASAGKTSRSSQAGRVTVTDDEPKLIGPIGYESIK